MNKLSAMTSIVFCVLGLSGCESRAEYNAEDLFKQVSPSIVTLLTFDEKGRQEGQGSGVIIGSGRIATNCHVVQEAVTLKVHTEKQDVDAAWIQTDPSRDICIVSAAGITAPAIAIRKLSDVRIGEPVFAVGNPLGFSLSVSSGLVSTISPYRNEQVIIASISLSPGSSGGGLFDTRGRLLGITTAILSAGQNLNIVLPAEWIGELDKRGVAPPTAISIPGPEPRWLEEAQALEHAVKTPELEKHARAWREDQPDSSLAAAYLAIAISEKRPIDAEAALRDAIRLDDNNEYVWFLLSDFLYRQGRKDQAEQALLKSLTLRPNRGGSYALKAGWRLAENKPQEAYADIKEALRLEPGASYHWQLLGVIADKLGHAEESVNAYQTALRLNPSDEKLKQALSQMLARQGKTDAARLSLGNDQDNAPASAETWFTLAYSEFERKRYADAEKAYRKAIAIAPEHTRAWLGLGIVLSATHRNKEAELAFDEGLKFKPDNPEVVINLLTYRANIRRLQGNPQAALADIEAALKINPDFAPTLRMLGILKTQSGDVKATADAFRKLTASGHADADEWVSLGESLEKLGYKTQALEALEKAEKLAPDSTRVLQAMTWFHGRNGDQQKALAYIEHALKLDSSDARIWSNKGYALLKLGRLPESISALETAVVLDPQFANAWINLGDAQMQSNSLGNAIKSLEKAIALTPAATDARYNLAKAYLSTGQTEKARTHADALLKTSADQSQAIAVLTLSYLMDKNANAALASYRKIQAKNPQAAKTVRSIAISQGLPGAQALPE